jgi:hypothetical protein
MFWKTLASQLVSSKCRYAPGSGSQLSSRYALIHRMLPAAVPDAPTAYETTARNARQKLLSSGRIWGGRLKDAKSDLCV